MSKAVLISINPEWVEKILNGEKTIEIRKTKPKCKLPCKVYIYCSFGNMKTNYALDKRGKVVAEFMFDHYNKFDIDGLKWYDMLDVFLRHSNLTKNQLKNYLGDGIGYAWQIRDLKIYDKPKELSEFTLPECEKSECACENCKHLEVINTPYAYETNCVKPRKLTKAPQSWCYVEEL